MSPLIEARGLTRILHETVPVTLVKDINLIIEEGEFVAVTGASGRESRRCSISWGCSTGRRRVGCASATAIPSP